MRAALRSSSLWIAALAVLLAFGFLGSRGIWDPDEGRYTNVALNMLDSGDWLDPQRNDDTGHWTKPPLTYWAIAASVAAFGQNTWAARLPAALSYLLCVWLAWRCARRLQPGTESTAAVVYATMLLPVGAAQFMTTDFPMAALQTLAMYAFIESRFGTGSHRQRWLWLMWAAYAAAFLAKGPPALLPLLATMAFQWLAPSPHPRRWLLVLSGLVLFLALALPWYVAVTAGHPGLLRYFLGAEVVERMVSDKFDRHGEWYGWLQIYAPTLLLGTLPWTPALWRWARGLPARLRRWRDPAARRADATSLLLTLWLLLPLLAFCTAQSRLPLYILPLFVPLALLAAQQRHGEGRTLPAWPRLAAWALLLVALRVASVYWPTHKNAAEWSDAILARHPTSVAEVVFVEDMARYGLRLHLDAEVEKLSLLPLHQSRFNPDYDEDLATELAETEADVVYVAKQAVWPQLQQRITALGYRATVLGAPYRDRVIFQVQPQATP